MVGHDDESVPKTTYERRGRALVQLALVAAAGLATAACPARPAPSAPSTPLAPKSVAPVASEAARPLRDRPPGPWATIGKGEGFEVLVERALYEKPGVPHFFVRVRVVNGGESALGVDLRSYWTVVSPNQWCASDQPERSVIDERSIMPPAFDAAARGKVLEDFRAGRFTSVAAHGSLDYFRDFNNSARADVDGQSRGQRFVLISMKGWLDVTDGARADRFVSDADVALDAPVSWATVPAGATVFGG